MDFYNSLILEYWQKQHSVKPLTNPDVEVKVVNQLCGDELTLQVKVNKSNRKNQFSLEEEIREVVFLGSGCVISQATAGILSEKMVGKKLADLKFSAYDLTSLLGFELTPNRLACGLLAFKALDKLLSIVKIKGEKRTSRFEAG